MPIRITAMGSVPRLGFRMAEADTSVEVVVITFTAVDAVVMGAMHTDST